jgi:hypothetical protein
VSAPFIIDRDSGRLRFPDLQLELRPMMPEAEFIAATAKINRDNLGSNQGWQRYSIRHLISNDRRLGLFLIFLNGKLDKLSFAYAHKDESWATWTEQGELERQKEYREELTAQLGGSDTFPWGRISAILDSKSGGTDIWVDYNPARQ